MTTATEPTPARAIDAALRTLYKERTDLDAKRAGITAQIARHERAKKALAGGGKKRQRSNGKLDPATVAGPKALKAIESMMKNLGRAAQATVVKRTKLNSGTVSYALRALEGEGKVRRTGDVDGRSPIWEIVSNGKQSTRVRVGESS